MKKRARKSKSIIKETLLDKIPEYGTTSKHPLKSKEEILKLNRELKSTSNRQDQDATLFPRHFHWIVFIFTLVFRIHYVIQKENWWILHPDEIYQTLEVANSEIYGYGFRPYEYLPPPDINNSNVTVARKHEWQLGMYSLRSFLLPRIFAHVGSALMFAGYTGNLFVVWKCFHVLVSSTLVISIYKLTKRIESHDVATLSSMFCASSVHLNVFGTHTLIHSFLSPVVFFVLSHGLDDDANDDQVDRHKKQKSITMLDPAFRCQYTDCNNTARTDGIQLGYMLDQNENSKKVVKDDKFFTEDNNVMNILDFVYANIQFAAIKTLVVGLSRGFSFGMLLYLRPDTIIIILGFHLAYRHSFKQIGSFVSGVIFAVIIGIKEDYQSYGAFVISPWQWFMFNVIGSNSTRLFGFQPTLYYLDSIFIENLLNLTLSIITCIFILCFGIYIRVIDNKSNIILTNALIKLKCMLKLCAIFICIIVIYSLKGHKETRFLHDAIPLLHIIHSEVMVLVYGLLSTKYNVRLAFYTALLVCMSSQLHAFISIKNSGISKWSYRGINDSHEVNICLDFIGQQSDVTGVFLDSTIHMTGAYTILRHNVPIIARNQNEFFKFGTDARDTMSPILFGGKNCTLFTFSRLTDFISLQNTQYLLKTLITDTAFNYIVIKINSNFIDKGYFEIYRFGNMRVLKRHFDTKHEDSLHKLSERLQLINNSRILNMEADWLIYFGAYNAAAERLLFSLTVDEKNLQTNQLLMHLFHIMGKNKQARRILHNCTKYHKSEICLSMPSHNHEY